MSTVDADTNTVREAMGMKDAKEWRAAIEEELASLPKQNTWDVPSKHYRGFLSLAGVRHEDIIKF